MGVGVLAAVSTIVGFNGWPGAAGGTARTPQAMLAEAHRAPAIERVAATERIVVPEARTQRRAQRSATRVTTPATDDSAREVSLAPEQTMSTPVAPRRVAGTGRTPTPAADEPKAGDPVRDAGDDLGSSTDQTVKDIGKVVEPVSPTLSNAIGDIGQVVGDTVQGVTNTLADVLDRALTKPSP